jgi:UDP-2,3-diacylglucosamine pyrophosphatase LpxH
MRGHHRINKAVLGAKRIPFTDQHKFVLMSDCHRGDGGWADNFANNQHIYFAALKHYYNNGFSYIELGDGDELWENRHFLEIARAHSHVFWLLGKYFAEDRLHFLYGNHDMVKKNKRWVKRNYHMCYEERSDYHVPLFPGIQVYESIILHHTDLGGDIVLLHGHQADFFNDRLWRIGRFLVRFLWRPLESFGLRNPTGTAKNYKKRKKVDARLASWSKQTQTMLIAGHTHRPTFPQPAQTHYFNDGSCVHPRCITAIEIEKGCITLVKWHVLTHPDGVLAVFRDVLEGPVSLKHYFT